MGAIAAVEVDSPPQYGVLEGPDGSNKMLLRNLRLAHVYRRRIIRNLAFDRHGCVAVVEEVV